MCLVIIMDGYDGFLVSSFFAVTTFQKRFGTQLPSGGWTIEAKWQTAFMVGGPVGRIAGALGVGILADKYGRKRVTLVALIVLTGITFIVFFAVNQAMLCVGWTLAGFIWGIFNTMGPTYLSEISPVKMRSTIAAAINLSWVAGQFLSTGVVTATEARTDEWAYRIPLAVQWVFPVFLIPLVALMPESPWWLLRQGEEEKTRKTLQRLLDDEQVDLDVYMEYMSQTIHEEENNPGTFIDCFKGVDLRRTEICAVSYFIQPLSGLYIIAYIAYFLSLAGIPQQVVFKLALGQSGLAFLTTIVAPFIILYLKRRSLYLGGMVVMGTTLFAIGILACYRSTVNNWITAVLLYFWVAAYNSSLGPLSYVIISETPSVRLRSKTIAVASIANSVLSLILYISVPYMMNEAEADMRGLVGFIYAPCCVIAIVWVWFRLPELKGMSFLEIDRFFESGRYRERGPRGCPIEPTKSNA